MQKQNLWEAEAEFVRCRDCNSFEFCLPEHKELSYSNERNSRTEMREMERDYKTKK